MKFPVEWPGAQGSVFDAAEVVAVTLTETDAGPRRPCQATVGLRNGTACIIARGTYESIACDIRKFVGRCAEALGNHGLCPVCGRPKGKPDRYCGACEREIAQRNLANAQQAVRDATS